MNEGDQIQGNPTSTAEGNPEPSSDDMLEKVQRLDGRYLRTGKSGIR